MKTTKEMYDYPRTNPNTTLERSAASWNTCPSGATITTWEEFAMALMKNTKQTESRGSQNEGQHGQMGL